jgi:hypothetical protein
LSGILEEFNKLDTLILTYIIKLKYIIYCSRTILFVGYYAKEHGWQNIILDLVTKYISSREAVYAWLRDTLTDILDSKIDRKPFYYMDNGVLLETKTLVIRHYIQDQMRVFSVFHPCEWHTITKFENFPAIFIVVVLKIRDLTFTSVSWNWCNTR